MMNYSGYPAPTYPNYGTVGQQQFYPQKQEVVRVNGQNGANAYQMAPNSSILLLAEYLACLIKDVNEELAQAQSLYIKKKSCDFDISSIMGDQEEKADKYGCKIKEIGK